VIDVGSTGSRLHIFELVTTFLSESKDRAQPLNATHVAHHMLPLFDYASDIIPPSFHASTPVRIAATAGMRLLPLDEQIRVYDALYEGLSEQIPNGRFTFSSLTRGDVFTLHGEREGFFGAVAANYLRGVIDAELRVIPDAESIVFALDMGGSSTQI
ncbi:apyrase, partial [Thalassiosira pseudonana CCMP1335]